MIIVLLLVIIAILIFGRNAVSGFFFGVLAVLALILMVVGIIMDPKTGLTVGLPVVGVGVWYYFSSKKDKVVRDNRRFSELEHRLRQDGPDISYTNKKIYEKYFSYENANPNLKNYDGETILYINAAKACKFNSEAFEIVRLILKHNVDVNLPNDLKPTEPNYITKPWKTPLWYAKKVAHNEKLTKLLEGHGAAE